MIITNWGNHPKVDAQVSEPPNIMAVQEAVTSSRTLIARGNGRCYGDSALASQIVSTRQLKGILAFDEEKGIIEVQAGLLLDDLLRRVVPKGWFLPVVPGTKMITIGGAIASNVHGKNHHQAGTFGDYIRSIEIINEKGVRITCTPEENTALFAMTIGGFGTSGVIVQAKLQLQRIETTYFRQQSLRAENLAEMLALIEQNQSSPYLVAWLDGLVPVEKLGAGILLVGQECSLRELPSAVRGTPLLLHQSPKINIPKLPVSWLMNGISLRLNNALYRWQNRHFGQSRVLHYSQFFFPLDALNNWKNLYGPPGLLQYQFVIPTKQALIGLNAVLKLIHQSRITPYLLVLKKMGQKSRYKALTDFPMPGYTLAIDFKNTAAARTLLNELDQLVIRHQGRVYLTKDSRLPARAFAQMYPVAAQQVPGKFRSLQSERIYGL